jgi:hypothetical protein
MGRVVIKRRNFSWRVVSRRARIPRLSDIRYEWESNYSTDDSPEGHMQPLIDNFETLKERFADDEMTVKIIERQIERANEWIGEHMPDEPEQSSRSLGNVEPTDNPQSARSIFDDIDAEDTEDE